MSWMCWDQVRKENGIIFPADKDPDVLKERLEQQLDFIREVDKVEADYQTDTACEWQPERK